MEANQSPRQAEASDSDAIAALHVKSWRATYRGILPDIYLDNEAVFSLGGKCAPDLTPPLLIPARIKWLAGGSFTCEGPMWRGVEFHMGPTMVLETGGVEVVVTSVPVAVMDLQVFRSVGIEPSRKATIALKSRNHFRAAYEPIARETMLVDAGGIASMRLSELPYTKIPRPIWPLDH